MPWSGGTFNRANGATGWADDQAANIGIEAGRHDTQDNDFRNGINDTLNKNGQNTPTANLPMGGFRHTGAGDAVGDADYTTYGQSKAGVNIAKASTVDYTVSQYTATTAGPTIALQKARGAAVGTNTIVNNGDTLGTIVFRGANGTTMSDAAQISALSNGTPGASNDMPGALTFATSADASATPTERMRIDSAGRVSIGAGTSPSLRLEVAGSDTFAGILNANAFFRAGGAPSSDGGILLSSETGNTPTITATNLNAGAGAPTPLRFVTNKAERLRITDNGAVGIGTSSPSGLVEIARSGSGADLTITKYENGSQGGVLVLQKSDSNTIGTNTLVGSGDTVGEIVFKGANGTSFTDAAAIWAVVDGTPGASNDMPGRLAFYTTPDASGTLTERMRLDSSGNLLIGATSPPPTSTRLHVRTSTSDNTTRPITFTNNGGTDLFVISSDGNFFTGTAAGSPYNLTTASAANMHVDSAGVLRRSTSSLKYKSEVENMEYGLNEVLSLRPVTFAQKNASNSNRRFAGFIAEEVDSAGLSEFVEYADDGTPDALGYANMVALAVKAIQELNAKVQTLEARIATLEAQ